MNRYLLLSSLLLLLGSCTGNKNVRVTIEVDDSLGFLQKRTNTLCKEVGDTLFTIERKVKVHVYPSNKNMVIHIDEIAPVLSQEFETKLECNYFYNIDRKSKERTIIYAGGLTAISQDDYNYLYFGLNQRIEGQDVKMIRDYFKNNGTLIEDVVDEEQYFVQNWDGVSMKQFKRDLPEFYEKYINTKKDSIRVKSRRLRMIGNHDKYIEQNYVIDYEVLFFED